MKAGDKIFLGFGFDGARTLGSDEIDDLGSRKGSEIRRKSQQRTRDRSACSALSSKTMKDNLLAFILYSVSHNLNGLEHRPDRWSRHVIPLHEKMLHLKPFKELGRRTVLGLDAGHHKTNAMLVDK